MFELAQEIFTMPVASNSSSDIRANGSSGPKKHNLESSQMAQEAIYKQWQAFPAKFKDFIFQMLDGLSLCKLLDFWLDPQYIGSTHGKIAGSLCGASWYLALVYLNLNKMKEARALTLNGAFLQQCYVSSSEGRNGSYVSLCLCLLSITLYCFSMLLFR